MRRFLERVARALGIGDEPRRAGHDDGQCLVFARIDDPLMPLQRGQKYEDPLNRALKQAGLGRVTGGGSVQGVDGLIEWISLDIQLVDLGPSLEFLQAKLLELGAPENTVLKFRKEGAVVAIPIR
jgi:hypothetical protein